MNATETQQLKYAKRTGCSLPEYGLTHKRTYAILHELGNKIYLKNDNKELIWFDSSGFKFAEKNPITFIDSYPVPEIKSSIKEPDLQEELTVDLNGGIYCETRAAICKCRGGKCIYSKFR